VGEFCLAKLALCPAGISGGSVSITSADCQVYNYERVSCSFSKNVSCVEYSKGKGDLLPGIPGRTFVASTKNLCEKAMPTIKRGIVTKVWCKGLKKQKRERFASAPRVSFWDQGLRGLQP